jgi:hypothetical protein
MSAKGQNRLWFKNRLFLNVLQIVQLAIPEGGLTD